MAQTRPAPSDAQAAAVWAQIMDLAERFALIVTAYGGIATLATPEEQRKVPGCRARVLQAHLMHEGAKP